jgi:hypothetical protein
LFQTTVKRRRGTPGQEIDPVEMAPTQIGRALRRLAIGWTAAHSPQAKGRVERSFPTAQDRLVKGLRMAGAGTLEDANRHLEQEFPPWWNHHRTVLPANPIDAHRPLGAQHNLGAILRCGDPHGGQQLHHSVSRKALSDRTTGYIPRTQGRNRARGNPAGRSAGGALWFSYVSISECARAQKRAPLKPTTRPRRRGPAHVSEHVRRIQQRPASTFAYTHLAGGRYRSEQNGSIGLTIYKECRANTARLALALYSPRPPLGGSTQVDKGLSRFFGASPVASAFGRDPNWTTST